jgi:hypothetical protein
MSRQERALRIAADELKCKFRYCSADCECSICTAHRNGKKTVVGLCYCSRCRSMYPSFTRVHVNELACADALRSRRGHGI